MDPRASLESFIRWVMRGTVFHGVYAATVEADNGDGTFELTPDDDAMRGLGMKRVPVRLGVPATGVSANQGTRCLFGFHNGDPRQPHIKAWEYARGSATLRLDGGGAAVARFGGAVTVLTEPVLAVTGIAGGTVQTPNPSPPPPTIPTPVPPGSPFIGTIAIAVPISGVIQQGAQKVWA